VDWVGSYVLSYHLMSDGCNLGGFAFGSIGADGSIGLFNNRRMDLYACRIRGCKRSKQPHTMADIGALCIRVRK
jgi:hypothetical protein